MTFPSTFISRFELKSYAKITYASNRVCLDRMQFIDILTYDVLKTPKNLYSKNPRIQEI